MKKQFFKRLTLTGGISAFIAYAIAVRFTNFLMFTKKDKAILLIALFIIIGINIHFLIQHVLTFLQKEVPAKLIRILLIFCILLTTVLLVVFYKFPPFPQTLSLEIQRLNRVDNSSPDGEVVIISILKVDLPSQKESLLSISQFDYKRPWKQEENALLALRGDADAKPVTLNKFMQGQVDILFQTSPDAGRVKILWNEETLFYDLQSPTNGTMQISLKAPFRWDRADLTRKIFLAGDILSEFFIFTFGFCLIGLFFIQILITRRIRVRGVRTLLALAVVSGICILSNNAIQKEVTFKDPNLEKLIRTTISKENGPIYRHQLLTIAALDASYKEISSLDGIEALQNLKSLNLSGNIVNDLTPIASLNKLSSLDLSYNQIIDLQEVNFQALDDLALETLNLRGNLSNNRTLIRAGLSNIEELEKLAELVELDLGENQIADISSLAKLTRLSILNLDSNRITDIQPLTHLDQLTYLNLRFNQVSDISPLKDHRSLIYLNLHGNSQIKDLMVLQTLDNLESLILDDIPIGNSLSFLGSLTKLSRLDLANCGVTDLTELGDLMSKDILQDKPNEGTLAEVSIRENPLTDQPGDPFEPIRDYWQNISTRDPVALPPLDIIPQPDFSHPGGFYTKPFKLTIFTDDPALTILYTLDGSEPDFNHLSNSTNSYQKTYRYNQSITITDRIGDPNMFSMINTADLVNEWLPLWVPPNGEVFKTNVVRAIAYDIVNGIASPIVTHTFFVDQDIYERYKTLPIISLTSDYQYLFDPVTGIYTPGSPTGLPDPSIGFNESIVPANIEFFNPDGSPGFSGVYEIELQGNTSRASPQKALSVTASGWYGEDMINFPIFSTSESSANQITAFKQFIIRAWGSARGWPVFFADAYNQTLMAKADQDIQDYRPVIVFINGEYWGLHELRESNKNSWYHQEHTGIDRVNPGFDLLDRGYNMVDEGTSQDWDALMDFISTHDLSIEENFQYVESRIDIDNFIHYIIHCIYAGKRDWPNHNESKWRVHDQDGKWRWLQYDMDHGLSQFGRPEYDMVYHTVYDENFHHPLLFALLKNEGFKNKFVTYFADDLNTYFSPEMEVAHFNQIADELAPYIQEFQNRWQISYDWKEGLNYGLELIDRRYEMRWNQVMTNFGIEATTKITLQTDLRTGSIRINSIEISDEVPGITDPAQFTGTYFIGIPVEITAIPLPGYHFLRWEGINILDATSPILTITLEEPIILKAVFERDT